MNKEDIIVKLKERRAQQAAAKSNMERLQQASGVEAGNIIRLQGAIDELEALKVEVEKIEAEIAPESS